MSVTETTRTKVCARCRAAKPLDAFHRDRSRKGGRFHRCRECVSAWQRAYYADDSAWVLWSKRRWHDRHRDAINERARVKYRDMGRD